MIGAEGTAGLLADGLRARVPDKLRDLEVRLALPAGALLNPKAVTPHDVDVLGLEDWPALMVVTQSTRPGMARVDVTAAGAAVYAVRYAFRVFAWVRGDTYRGTDLARKRLVLAVREVLVERLGLDPEVAYTDVGSIEESYSDVVVDNVGRTIAGAYTAVELVAVESANGPPVLGAVATVRADTAALPPHPAL